MPAVTAQPPTTRGMVWCHLPSCFFHGGNNLSCKDTLTKMPPLQKICIFLPGWFRASNLYRTGVHLQMLSRQTWGRHVVLRPWLNDKRDPDSILWALLLKGDLCLYTLCNTGFLFQSKQILKSTVIFSTNCCRSCPPCSAPPCLPLCHGKGEGMPRWGRVCKSQGSPISF